MTLPDSWNDLEEYDQRPCSVQLTGILVSETSLSRIEVLSTRFCLAPASSSPSMSSMGLLQRLMTSSSGTEPEAEVSEMVTSHVARASPKGRYWKAPSGGTMTGRMAMFL